MATIHTFGILKQKWQHKMEIAIIAALSENYVIGKNGKIPWKIPEDLKRFRELTLNNAVIMGRKTYESVGKPLNKRLNIVLTTNFDFKAEGVIVCHNLEEALKAAQTNTTAYVIGGEKVYRDFIPLATRLELTHVHSVVDGDTFFPKFNAEEWEKNHIQEIYEGGTLLYSFVRYRRK